MLLAWIQILILLRGDRQCGPHPLVIVNSKVSISGRRSSKCTRNTIWEESYLYPLKYILKQAFLKSPWLEDSQFSLEMIQHRTKQSLPSFFEKKVDFSKVAVSTDSHESNLKPFMANKKQLGWARPSWEREREREKDDDDDGATGVNHSSAAGYLSLSFSLILNSQSFEVELSISSEWLFGRE